MGSACSSSGKKEVMDPSQRASHDSNELFQKKKLKFTEERRADDSTISKTVQLDFGKEGEDQEASFVEYPIEIKEDPLKKIREEQEAYDKIEREMRMAIPNKEKKESTEAKESDEKTDEYVENFNRWNAVENNAKRLANQRAKFDNSRFKKNNGSESTLATSGSGAVTNDSTANSSITFEPKRVSQSLNTSLWGEDPLGRTGARTNVAILEVHDSRQDTVDEIDRLLKDLQYFDPCGALSLLPESSLSRDRGIVELWMGLHTLLNEFKRRRTTFRKQRHFSAATGF